MWRRRTNLLSSSVSSRRCAGIVSAASASAAANGYFSRSRARSPLPPHSRLSKGPQAQTRTLWGDGRMVLHTRAPAAPPQCEVSRQICQHRRWRDRCMTEPTSRLWSRGGCSKGAFLASRLLRTWWCMGQIVSGWGIFIVIWLPMRVISALKMNISGVQRKLSLRPPIRREQREHFALNIESRHSLVITPPEDYVDRFWAEIDRHEDSRRVQESYVWQTFRPTPHTCYYLLTPRISHT